MIEIKQSYSQLDPNIENNNNNQISNNRNDHIRHHSHSNSINNIDIENEEELKLNGADQQHHHHQPHNSNDSNFNPYYPPSGIINVVDPSSNANSMSEHLLQNNQTNNSNYQQQIDHVDIGGGRSGIIVINEEVDKVYGDAEKFHLEYYHYDDVQGKKELTATIIMFILGWGFVCLWVISFILFRKSTNIHARRMAIVSLVFAVPTIILYNLFIIAAMIGVSQD
ncbi:hypothetical protein DFA_00120 [Cavenderia fasciculata]|uniref:Transmembrane protein n=1 Tax=Cavenderia fasciculata TaxID=261658 RepID=F4PXN2_CACFS|nr:uncharacterized protein DFA_00120 [Cavenderia fasciculata]EGG19542.1 hypothetical protein DFA_00120 [Cavenderia fasciculata]|eukprot:XP_004357836.1 hypothetical protein DFA_00120 [Cavenderia fasciculata]